MEQTPTEVTKQSDIYHRILALFRRFIFKVNDILHGLVALVLLLAAAATICCSLSNFTSLSTASILNLVNDILFVVIILELLWTMITYLKRQEFPIASFIFIGIISSIRRMLLIEAQVSMGGDAAAHFEHQMMELGMSTAIVLILSFSYYLISRASKAK